MDCDLTHPASAYGAQSQLTIEDFKRRLCNACNHSLTSPKSKRYNKVRVLLLHWDQEDLNIVREVEQLRYCFEQAYGYKCDVQRIPVREVNLEQLLLQSLDDFMEGTDENDLLIFYYAGRAIMGDQNQWDGPCIFVSDVHADVHTRRTLDLSGVKNFSLDKANADVLYLLDCSYFADDREAASGIGPAKELIAAANTVEEGSDPGAFTSALTQELTNAYEKGPQHSLTTAQLYEKLLLSSKPLMHGTPMPHAALQQRPCILLSPNSQSTTSSPSSSSSSSSTAPSTIPIPPYSNNRRDRRVQLSVHLTSHDGIEPILQYLKDWWSSRLPANNSDTGVSFKYATAASNSSGIFVFTMSVAAYYCLQSHAAIRFIGYVGTTEAVWRLEELKQWEQEEPVVWRRKEWEQYEAQRQHEAQGQPEAQGHQAKHGKKTGDGERVRCRCCCQSPGHTQYIASL